MDTYRNIIDEIIECMTETFLKSSILDFKKYLHSNKTTPGYIISSDYCIDDEEKFNDVFSFTLWPNISLLEEYKKIIRNFIPRDIKKTRDISEKILLALRQLPILTLNFIIPKTDNKFYSLVKKEGFILGLDKTKEMINTWIKNEPHKKEFYENDLKQVNLLIQEMQRNNFNAKLFFKQFLLATFSGFITHQILKNSNAKDIIWFSDRDSMTEANNGFMFELYSFQHNGFMRNDPEYTEKNIRLGIGTINNNVKNETNRIKKEPWFDEIIRIPDYLAGSYAAFDFMNNSFLKEKFEHIVKNTTEKCINILISYDKEKGSFNAARLCISKM